MSFLNTQQLFSKKSFLCLNPLLLGLKELAKLNGFQVWWEEWHLMSKNSNIWDYWSFTFSFNQVFHYDCLKWSFPAFLGSYDRLTDKPTNRQTLVFLGKLTPPKMFKEKATHILKGLLTNFEQVKNSHILPFKKKLFFSPL